MVHHKWYTYGQVKQEAGQVATKLPRLNVVLEPHLYQAIFRLSKKEGLSLSLVARDLIREALVIYEDAFWAKEAKAREATLTKQKTLSHKQVWGWFVPHMFEINYHPDVVKKDLPKIVHSAKQRIRKAIDVKLTNAPEEFGEPLRRTLKGYWKLRVGDYRVIYKISKAAILILRIGHRRDVYKS